MDVPGFEPGLCGSYPRHARLPLPDHTPKKQAESTMLGSNQRQFDFRSNTLPSELIAFVFVSLLSIISL